MRLEYFQMIDRVTACSAEALTAEARVPKDSTVFEGHFPGYPLVPGVLLVETMAQASGYLLLARDFSRMPFLAQVKEAKFRGFVAPETLLTVEASLVHEGSGYAVTTGKITAAGKRVADAELVFRILPFPAPELEAAMRAQAAGIGVAAAQVASGQGPSGQETGGQGPSGQAAAAGQPGAMA
jgi:3-hydroxyacyl-[acyl-carrier-protein] dehydratase